MLNMSQISLSEGEMIFIVSLKLTKQNKFVDAEQHISKLILHLAEK